MGRRGGIIPTWKNVLIWWLNTSLNPTSRQNPEVINIAMELILVGMTSLAAKEAGFLENSSHYHQFRQQEQAKCQDPCVPTLPFTGTKGVMPAYIHQGSG